MSRCVNSVFDSTHEYDGQFAGCFDLFQAVQGFLKGGYRWDTDVDEPEDHSHGRGEGETSPSPALLVRRVLGDGEDVWPYRSKLTSSK